MSNERTERERLADEAAARTLAWLVTAGVEIDEPGLPDSDLVGADRSVDLLDGVREDAEGFAFARKLLEAVISAGDPFAAALGLRAVARDLPDSMPVVEKLAVRASGFASLGLPWAVLPIARKWLRERVSHLVFSAKEAADEHGPVLTGVDAGLRESAVDTTVALLGPTLLGDAGVKRELERLKSLIRTSEVEHLSIDVSRIAPVGLNGDWALDADAKLGAKRLRSLLKLSIEHDTSILLEASDYRGSLLAPQILIQALTHPGLGDARVGVNLPAELPESLQSAQALIQFSRVRVGAGGAALEVGVNIAGLAAREQIQSILTGHAVPIIEGQADQSAQWLRIVETLLSAGDAVRITACTEDAHLLAVTTLLAEQARQQITLQLRAGVAPELEAAMREHGFAVRRRQSVVIASEFDAAASYLIALAAETALSDSVLVHTRALLSGESTEFRAGTRRAGAAVVSAQELPPDGHRLQHRGLEWSEEARDTAAYYQLPTEMHRLETAGLTAAVLGLTRAHTGAITMEVLGDMLRIPIISATGFANEPDTDGSRFDNREWARAILGRAKRSDIGLAAKLLAVQSAGSSENRDEVVDDLITRGANWAQMLPVERSTRVTGMALGIAAARDRLLEALAAETGASISVIDADVTGSVDAVRYLGQLTSGLAAVRGARVDPDRLTLVVVDAGVPLAERAEVILAPLAAGSAVLVVAHPSVARSTAVLIEQLQAADLPGGVLRQMVAESDGEAILDQHLELASKLAVDTRFDRAVVVGHRATAQAILRRRPDLSVQGRFRAQGVTVVTPSADPLLAVRNVVTSAFGASHADANTARAVVLLGAAARSQAFRDALADAVSALPVGRSSRPGKNDALSLTVGALAEPPSEAGLRSLTQLDVGEQWLVKPERIDRAGLLWKPGVRTGVARDARFWQDSVGMPVIGLIAAHTVDEAISLTNRLGGGGVAAIEANDPSETLPWLERASAASIFVGRPTTHPRTERQPSGGWREAGMGDGMLAGGPNRLFTFGTWSAREGTASSTLHLRGLTPEVRVLIEVAQSSLDYQSFDRIRRAALSDTLTWRTSFGKSEDVSGLGIERNMLRYRPVDSHVRLSEDAQVADLIRVVGAGLVAGASMTVSTGLVLPPEVSEFLNMQGITVSLERDDAWLERVSIAGPGDGESQASRVRLIGGDRARTAEWIGRLGDVSIWSQPVTLAGPIELLAFVREQAVSISAHRHDLAMLPAGVGGWLAELQGRESR